jgi:PAT family beta-lactamase induction signal transducer AmpG
MQISLQRQTNTWLAEIYRSRSRMAILLLGFSSGLPAALTASTLQAWFTQAGCNLQTIGAITLLVIPYGFRFLWAPIFDYYKIPGIDLRRGWLLALQLLLVAAICIMALTSPLNTFQFYQWHIPWLMTLGFGTAFLASSQEMIVNAYQIEILPPTEQALGAAIYVTGWRLGAIISGALALIMASFIGWKITYFSMSGLMIIGLIGTYIAPAALPDKSPKPSLYRTSAASFLEFFQRYPLKNALIFILLIITYKAGDALALALNTTFLLRHIGFDLATIGLVNKTVSVISALLGGLTAGILMKKMSLYRALILFGLVQGITNLSYALIAYYGKNLFLLVFSAFAENFFSGMGTIALLALIMALCNIHYTATQFALLSAITFLARIIVGPVAATLVEILGWQSFFIWCFILSLPTLLCVYANKNIIQQLHSKPIDPSRE